MILNMFPINLKVLRPRASAIALSAIMNCECSMKANKNRVSLIVNDCLLFIKLSKIYYAIFLIIAAIVFVIFVI